MPCTIFPLLGGWLADRFIGKYNTIFWLSLIYCVGQAFLAIFYDNRTGFYAGLGLIALGSGGIKPCVSAFIGDQFDQTNKHLAKLVFDAFYWIINFGSFFASLLCPLLLRKYGPTIAFGVPGVLMFIATFILWLARKRYVYVPPAPPNPDSFLNVAKCALLTKVPGQGRPGFYLATLGALFSIILIVNAVLYQISKGLALMPVFGVVPSLCLALVAVLAFAGLGTSLQLDRASTKHSEEVIEGVRSVLRFLIICALVTPFWSLFDQKASTWILQANEMSKPSWFHPAQMQALNPALVMILIPFNNLVFYPMVKRAGYELTPLRKMAFGIVLTGISYIIVGGMQLVLDGGNHFTITWQVLPYAFLTLGEVLVSTTGLEFAYSQAPPDMKASVIICFGTICSPHYFLVSK